MALEQKCETADLVSSFYEEYLLRDGERNRSERGYLKFHPSSFGDCFRKTALQYYGELFPDLKDDSPIDTKFQRICAAGHSYHERMQTVLSKIGILRGCWKCKRCGKVHGKEEKLGTLLPDKCDCEAPAGDNRHGMGLFDYVEIRVADEEYNFEGHIDGVVEIKDRGYYDGIYVIDFKSINAERFALLREPEEKYKTQINIYMWLLGLDRGIIYYEDKNRHEIKEFVQYRDETRIDEIKKTSKNLLALLETKKLPKIPTHYEKDKKPCKWCEYLKRCWSKDKK